MRSIKKCFQKKNQKKIKFTIDKVVKILYNTVIQNQERITIMFWIKFRLSDVRYYLKMYDDYPICSYHGFGYVFRDNYEWLQFYDRHKDAELIF